MNTEIILGNSILYKIPYNNETKYHYIQTIVGNKNKIELDIDNPKQYTWIKYLFNIEFNKKKYQSYLKKISSCPSEKLEHFPKPFNVIENYKMIYWLYSNFGMRTISTIVVKIVYQLIRNIEYLNNSENKKNYIHCNLLIKKFRIQFIMTDDCPKKIRYSFFTNLKNNDIKIETSHIEQFLVIPYNVTIFDYIKTFRNLTFKLFDNGPMPETVISDGFFYDINKSWSNVIIIHSDTYKFRNYSLDFVTIPLSEGCLNYIIDYDICIFVFKKMSAKTKFFFENKKLYVDIDYLVRLYQIENKPNNDICIYENTIIKINKTNNKSMLYDVVDAIDMTYFSNCTKKEMIYEFIQAYLTCYN